MSDVLGGARPEPVLKKVDAWWTVLVVDPLAVRLVRVVARFAAITPTLLTVVAHLLGVVSAALFAGGQLVAAAVVFEVRFVIDCADGKLARLRGTSSARGAFLDYVGDYLVVGANMAAVALHLTWSGDVPDLIGIALPATFLAHITAGQARETEVLASGSARPPVERLPGAYRAWLAARRMRSTPSRIEAEHALLFIAPLVTAAFDAPGVLAGTAWVVTAYFAYRTLRISAGGFRIAAERDRSRH